MVSAWGLLDEFYVLRNMEKCLRRIKLLHQRNIRRFYVDVKRRRGERRRQALIFNHKPSHLIKLRVDDGVCRRRIWHAPAHFAAARA